MYSEVGYAVVTHIRRRPPSPVSHLRRLRDGKDATGFSRDLWKAFAEMDTPYVFETSSWSGATTFLVTVLTLSG